VGIKKRKMKHYITFEKAELNSTITTLGFNLHNIAEQITYFQQYAKIQGVEHDFVINSAIEKINESLTTLKSKFNLPIESNSCLELITENKIEEVVKRANKDHDNPYRATIPKMKELIRSFNAIAEREGKETNWEGIKLQCAKML
jgi:hypothetical protein